MQVGRAVFNNDKPDISAFIHEEIGQNFDVILAILLNLIIVVFNCDL